MFFSLHFCKSENIFTLISFSEIIWYLLKPIILNSLWLLKLIFRLLSYIQKTFPQNSFFLDAVGYFSLFFENLFYCFFRWHLFLSYKVFKIILYTFNCFLICKSKNSFALNFFILSYYTIFNFMSIEREIIF